MVEFKNCLRKGDVVLNIRTKKRGVVFRSPQEWDRNVAVLSDGKKRHRTVDVLDLRFVPPGDDPEDVPPIEGELLPVGMKKAAPKNRRLLEEYAGLAMMGLLADHKDHQKDCGWIVIKPNNVTSDEPFSYEGKIYHAGVGTSPGIVVKLN